MAPQDGSISDIVVDPTELPISDSAALTQSTEKVGEKIGYAVVPLHPKTSDNTVIEYIVIPLAALLVIGIIVVLVVWLCRRNRAEAPADAENGEEVPLAEEGELKPEVPADGEAAIADADVNNAELPVAEKE